MNRIFKFAGIFLGLIVASSDYSVAVQQPKQQKIVFFGDSITRQGDQPNGYVQIVRKVLAEAGSNQEIEVIGAGVGGNKVPDLLKRLDRDVLSKQPTTVVVYIGINDVWHSTKDSGTPKDVYEQGLRELIQRIRDANANVILCTPSVIGEKTDGSNPLDKMLDEYADVSRMVASAKNVALLDLRAAFVDQLKRINPENKDKGILTRDGVHLNEKGNLFVAERMISVLGVDVNTATAGENLIRHIVLFKFTDGLEQNKVDEVVKAFAELPNQIDEIVDFEMGTNISPEKLDQGFTHCFVVSFKNVEDRDAYLPHPAHKAFVKLLDGRIDKVLVFDFEK